MEGNAYFAGAIPSSGPSPQNMNTAAAAGDSDHEGDDGNSIALHRIPATPISENPPTLPIPVHVVPPASAAQNVQFRPLDSSRQPSVIRLRRLRGDPPSRPSSRPPSQFEGSPGQQPIPQNGLVQAQVQGESHNDDGAHIGRRRASSEPQRPVAALAPLDMTRTVDTLPPIPGTPTASDASNMRQNAFGSRAGRVRGRRFWRPHRDTSATRTQEQVPNADCYDSRIVDFLDVIDPEVATLSSITNIQNSLFVPSLGRWVNRRPTYDLSRLPRMPGAFPTSQENVGLDQSAGDARQDRPEDERPGVPRAHSFSSVLTAPQYAVLPKDASLEGWREEDIKLLNDYVRHMLHSRRSKIKQRFKGFIKYCSRPLGFFITLYATLITLFGLAWVLFLIGWIYVGERQVYAINVIDNVLVALFAIMGDGLAPFRAIDTYHMIFVAHYHRKTWKMRQKLLLPNLKDHNDLPLDVHKVSEPSDLEAGPQYPQKDEFIPVLSDAEQAKLVHHQSKLAKSHTFYKPHETETHNAFPLRLLVAIVVLLDLHSCLQITLGSYTWSKDYDHRLAAVTTTVLCLSITANSTAGLLITIGDRRTRKKDVLERLMKEELTEEAIHKVQKQKQKETEKEEDKQHIKSPRPSYSLSLP